MTTILSRISSALEYQMTNLRDDNNRKVFDKVIIGLGENDVKQFQRCLGVAYVKGADQFNNTLGSYNKPQRIKTVVAFVVKGTQRARYDEAMNIADIMFDKFQHDTDWIHLSDNDGRKNVKLTKVTDFNVSLFPNNKRLDIACVFTLEHDTC